MHTHAQTHKHTTRTSNLHKQPTALGYSLGVTVWPASANGPLPVDPQPGDVWGSVDTMSNVDVASRGDDFLATDMVGLRDSAKVVARSEAIALPIPRLGPLGLIKIMPRERSAVRCVKAGV